MFKKTWESDLINSYYLKFISRDPKLSLTRYSHSRTNVNNLFKLYYQIRTLKVPGWVGKNFEKSFYLNLVEKNAKNWHLLFSINLENIKSKS